MSFIFMRANCNFIATIELTNDECRLTHTMHAKKHWGSERFIKMLSNK